MNGATIRHLRTAGSLSSQPYAAGIVSQVWIGKTVLIDCESSGTINSKSKVAYAGGLVGYVNAEGLEMVGCVFSGTFAPLWHAPAWWALRSRR